MSEQHLGKCRNCQEEISNNEVHHFCPTCQKTHRLGSAAATEETFKETQPDLTAGFKLWKH